MRNDSTPYYQDDAVTLYNGDCAAVLAGLEQKADLILTSPPYDNLRDYGGHGFDFERVADACAGALADGGVLVWVVADATIDGSETCSSFRQAIHFKDVLGLKLHDTMIYESTRLGTPAPNRYHQAFDYMFVITKGAPNTFNPILKLNVSMGRKFHADSGTGKTREGLRKQIHNSGRETPRYGKRTNIWRYGTNPNQLASDYGHNKMPEHPAIFSLQLAKDHIRTWTDPGGLVIDPMAGSGTTLRAAKDLNRRAIGVEIHEPYCELAARRMAQAVLPIADASSQAGE